MNQGDRTCSECGCDHDIPAGAAFCGSCGHPASSHVAAAAPGASRYVLHEKLGSGGVGEVWAALDTRLQRRVAVKILHPWVINDPEMRARFLREAQTLAQLHHPNIVQVYDLDESNGTVRIVMEIVQGEDLETSLAGRLPLPEGEAARLTLPVAEALAYAHGRGIVHRDVKPHNVLVDGGGQIKLTDFGLARLAQQTQTITRPGAAIGSPEYWAPEQAAGEPVGPGADVYSLGSMLYRLLVGDVPFPGEDRLAAGFRRVHEPAPQLLHSHPLLALAPLVDRMLLREPQGRPSSAEVVRELTARIPSPALAGGGNRATVSSRETIASSRPLPRAGSEAVTLPAAVAARAARGRRSALLAGAGFAAVCALGAASALLVLRGNEEVPPAPPTFTSKPDRSPTDTRLKVALSPVGDAAAVLRSALRDPATKADLKAVMTSARQLAEDAETARKEIAGIAVSDPATADAFGKTLRTVELYGRRTAEAAGSPAKGAVDVARTQRAKSVASLAALKRSRPAAVPVIDLPKVGKIGRFVPAPVKPFASRFKSRGRPQRCLVTNESAVCGSRPSRVWVQLDARGRARVLEGRLGTPTQDRGEEVLQDRTPRWNQAKSIRCEAGDYGVKCEHQTTGNSFTIGDTYTIIENDGQRVRTDWEDLER